jgi:hypothetical protein
MRWSWISMGVAVDHPGGAGDVGAHVRREASDRGGKNQRRENGRAVTASHRYAASCKSSSESVMS